MEEEKYCCRVQDEKDSYQEIPNAEMGPRRQAILPFLWTLTVEQGAESLCQVFRGLLGIGRHTILP